MTINIAYVIDTIETPNAGTEKQLLMLIENLDKKQFSPHLICLRSSQWLKNSKLCFPVFILNLQSVRPLALTSALKKFRKYCMKNNVEIAQTFFVDANIFGSFAAYLSGVKVIISSRRNYGLGYWHNTYWLALLKVLRTITSCYIANSQSTAHYTAISENVRKDNLHVIYNGLYLERFKQMIYKDREKYRALLGIKPNDILIGAVANLRPIKNLPLFIKTAAMAHKKYPQTRFVIVGHGPEEDNLKEMIRDYSLEHVFSLAGQQKDVLPFLVSMDIGILCSTSESLSNAIIEYMAAGLPCVVSDVGGNSEAIGNKYGFLFKSDNAMDFFAKLELLIIDEHLRLSVGQAAKDYAVFNYDHKQIVKQYQDIYYKYCRMNGY